MVAFIAATSTVIAALVQRSRRENKRDHSAVIRSLDRLGRQVDRVADRMDRHMEWHADRDR